MNLPFVRTHTFMRRLSMSKTRKWFKFPADSSHPDLVKYPEHSEEDPATSDSRPAYVFHVLCSDGETRHVHIREASYVKAGRAMRRTLLEDYGTESSRILSVDIYDGMEEERSAFAALNG